MQDYFPQPKCKRLTIFDSFSESNNVYSKMIYSYHIQNKVKSCVPFVVGRGCLKENHLIVENWSMCHQISPTLKKAKQHETDV